MRSEDKNWTKVASQGQNHTSVECKDAIALKPPYLDTLAKQYKLKRFLRPLLASADGPLIFTTITQ